MFGLKNIDDDAVDPITGLPMLCQMIENSEGILKKIYFGAQSTEYCVVAGVCLMKEKEAMQTKCFHRIIDFMKELETVGLKANRDEAAIPLQNKRSLQLVI